MSRGANVDELLADEDRLWLELTEVFGDVSPERFDEPSVTPEGWSPKDVMYHVAAWAEEAATVLGRIAAGTHNGSDPDTQALNEEWFEVGRGLDDDVVRIRFAKGRTAMRQAFTRLPDVDAAAWEWFEESGPRHYQEHLPDLRTFLERGTPRP
ncbi:MAG: maleylpyruvate isomerase N-terminal domain-containing protein [Actinomycetota bacterium]